MDLFEAKKQQLDEQELLEDELQNKLKSHKVDALFDDFFDEMRWNDSLVVKKRNKKLLFHFEQLDLETGKLKSKLGTVDVEKEMQTSILQPGIEKEHSLPRYDVSDRVLKAQRKVRLA